MRHLSVENTQPVQQRNNDNDKYIFRETPQRKILDTFETLNIFLTIENNNHSCNVFAHTAPMNLPVLNIHEQPKLFREGGKQKIKKMLTGGEIQMVGTN